MDNSAIELIQMIRKQGAHYNVQEVFMGKVASVTPLKIKFQTLTVNGNVFMKTRQFQHLLDEDCTRTGCTCPSYKLKTGDEVLILYSKELDKYILLDKVVK